MTEIDISLVFFKRLKGRLQQPDQLFVKLSKDEKAK